MPITDTRMTRFMISLDQSVDLVFKAFEDMQGGEIYVKKIPSMKVTELAKAISADAKLKVTGIRAGEKIHEQMISPDDSIYTYGIRTISKFYQQLPAGTRMLIESGMAKRYLTV